MVKAVTSTYLTQENRAQGAQFVYKITYQKSVGSQITIPLSEVISAPTISNTLGSDFMALSGGDIQLTLDNRRRQWDETYASAYNRPQYDGDLRVSAGFTLPNGTDELVELFSGKIVKVEMSGVTPRNAIITAKNAMSDKIAKTMIGKPATGGTPNPYINGYLSRVQLFDLDPVDYTFFTFLYKGTLSEPSLAPAVLKRRDDKSNWKTISPSSIIFSNNTKTAILNSVAAQDANEVFYSGIRKNPNTQIPYIIKDILLNQVKIPSTHINATSFDRIRNIEQPASWGVQIYNESAAVVIEQLSRLVYAAAFIEGKKFNLVSLGTPPYSGIHLHEGDYLNFSIAKDKSRIINQVDIPYHTYPMDTSKIVRVRNATSQASYGSLPLSFYYGDFSFTQTDPINSAKATFTSFYTRLANTIVRHNANARRAFTLSNVFSKGLRIELGDRVQLTNAFFDIEQQNAIVVGKTVDLERKRTDLMLLSLPHYRAKITQNRTMVLDFREGIHRFSRMMDEVPL